MSAKIRPHVTTLFNKENTSPVFEVSPHFGWLPQMSELPWTPPSKGETVLNSVSKSYFRWHCCCKENQIAISLRAAPTENTGQKRGYVQFKSNIVSPTSWLTGRPFSKCIIIAICSVIRKGRGREQIVLYFFASPISCMLWGSKRAKNTLHYIYLADAFIRRHSKGVQSTMRIQPQKTAAVIQVHLICWTASRK